MLPSNNQILLITSSNFPNGGASANVLRLLSIGLTKIGSKVHVLLQRGKQFGKLTKEENKTGWIDGVFYQYCGYSIRPKQFFKKCLDSFLGILVPLMIILKKKINKQVDIVWIYNSNTFEIFLILILCKILNIPVINHVVEWYSKESVITAWWKIFKWWDFLFGIKFMNRFFDGLVVTSKFLKDYYLASKVSEKNIFILPNLVDISFFQSETALKLEDITLIGYCGTPTKKDGIDDLLEAFKILNKKNQKTKLIIIGDDLGPVSLIPGLKEKARILGIEERVEFTGLVEWNKMPELLNSCDILVLARPSGRFAEAGFPTKLGEYMACHKPVVVTRVSDIPLYLQDGINAMIVEPDNPQSIAEKISVLIEDPELAKRVGENGFKWANEKLNYLNASKEICSFIDGYKK